MKICTCLFGISNFKLTLKSFIFVENISNYSGNYHIGVKCRSILNHFPSNLSKTKICEHVVDHIEGKYAVRTWKGRIPCRVLSISCISQISRNVEYYSHKFHKNYIELKHFSCFISHDSGILNLSVLTQIILNLYSILP